MGRFTRLIILMASVFIHSCAIPKYEDYVEQWTGNPIQRLINVTNRDGVGLVTKYQLDNGNNVYAYPESKRCIIHWEVDDNGIIVGAYKTEGDCRF